MDKNNAPDFLKLNTNLGRYIREGDINNVDVECRESVIKLFNQLTEEELKSIREMQKTMISLFSQ